MAAPPAGDWFHCNRCYRQEGARFSVTSCGHVLCEACLGAGPCPICAAACRRFPIPEQLEETLFLKSPAAIARQRLAHISQAWRFQQAQVDLLLASHRDTARRAEAALRDTRRALDSKQREAEALRRENGELRRHLREAEVSPTWRSSRSSTPRPIGITSPATTVTPQPRQQLSGQVVSRLASLEFPSASSTPTWLAPSPGFTPSLAHSPPVAEPTMSWPRPSSYCLTALCSSRKCPLECWWNPCIVQQCGIIAAILEFYGIFWGCQRDSLLPHGAPHPSRPGFHLLLNITVQVKVCLKPGNFVEAEPGCGKPKNLMLGMPRPNGNSYRSCALCERTPWWEPHGPIEASAEQLLLMGILWSYGGNLRLGVGLMVGTHSYMKASRRLIST
ncbi:RING finger protein 212B isoform X1 [Phasianus colchicus]|uniref:RING finger protein 212B isoform X1 n=1 Tax=Phasianus colchicus TaxID=9054 RepID=UPI00129E510C|nr:RING finger protein 212B isoform X1 [Phasianus colchicus]